MKKIIILILFALTVMGASGQTDSIKVRPVIQEKNQVMTPRTRAINTQLTKMEALLKQLEASLNELNDQIDKMKDQKDTLSEISEMQQLKMQMIMDRMTKADSAASNAIKKFSEVCSQIIANMK